MPKTITSIGSLDDVGCCILGLGGMGLHSVPTDEMMGIAGADDDSFDIYIDDPADPEPFVSDFDPAFIPNTLPALQVPDAGPGGSLTPKPAGWARGDGSYIVQKGDTLSGLARIYLGDAGRFRAIWDVQSTAYRATRTPDNIRVGDQLVMTDEARKKAQSLGYYHPGISTIPTSTGSSSSTPPVVTAPVPKTPAATPTSHKVALGVAAALSAGFGLLLWQPPASGQRRAPARRRR